MPDNLIQSIKDAEAQAGKIAADAETNSQMVLKSLNEGFQEESNNIHKNFHARKKESLEKAELEAEKYRAIRERELKNEIDKLEKGVSDNKDKAISFILEKLMGKE